ncbi:hypothetical protein HK101_006805 [Irineochytrium annulatum]|nr:hypothetical protein HK101_006805 [Irineochytrium annulatum]
MSTTTEKAALRRMIDQKLVKSGEKDRLKEYLRKSLTESGWRDEMKQYCKDIVRAKGMDQVTVEELSAEITPKGRAAVPDSIKAELLQRIRKILAED